MTANTIQHITARRHTITLQWHRSRNGHWFTSTAQAPSALNRIRTRRFSRLPHDEYHTQRGAITQPTITTIFGLVVLVSVTLLGLFYLNQVLGTASQGSDVQMLNEKVNELQEKQRQLELEGAELRSMQSIEKRVQDLNLVGVGHVTYLAETHKEFAAAP